MRVILFCILVLFVLCGCRLRSSKKETVRGQRIALYTSQTEAALKKYSVWRKTVTDFFKIPAEATAEEIRPHVAHFFHLSETASWEDISRVPLLQAVCTEERRRKFNTLFGLPAGATWVELGLHVEQLWVRMRASQ